MSFFNERFPERISYGAVGGPQWSTQVGRAQNGFSSRQRNWLYPLHRYDVSQAIKTNADFERVRSFFWNVYGAADGFRFKDFSDFRATTETGGLIDRGDGTFQLARIYALGVRSFARPIKKPVPGTVVLTGGGVVDYDTGIVTGGAPTGWTGEFDVPVNFVSDRMAAAIENHNGRDFLMSWGSIELEEVRL